MKTSVVIDISPPVLYLVKFWVSSYGLKYCQPIKLQDSLHLKKEVNDEMMKHWNLLQVDSIILDVCDKAFPKYPK